MFKAKNGAIALAKASIFNAEDQKIKRNICDNYDFKWYYRK